MNKKVLRHLKTKISDWYQEPFDCKALQTVKNLMKTSGFMNADEDV